MFTGDTLNIFAWVNQAPAGSVRLTGTTQGASAPFEIASATISASGKCPALSRLAAHSKLHALQVTTDAASADEKAMADFAVAYQLVTPLTNFVLVHLRAEGEKAAEMPELVKVAQMVPAGWGGTGRLASPQPSIPHMASFAACDNLNVPSVLRNPRSHASANLQTQAASGMDHRDIPAFLRRAAGPALNAIDDIAGLQEIASSNAKFWIREPSYVGMTPLGVAELLRINSQDLWPASYDDYAHVDLGRWVLDWLEFAVGNDGSQPVDEKIVVAAFNHVMGQPESFEYLNKRISQAQWVDAVTRSLGDQTKARHPAIRTDAGIACARLIIRLLARMQPQQWPEQVIGLSKDVC